MLRKTAFTVVIYLIAAHYSDAQLRSRAANPNSSTNQSSKINKGQPCPVFSWREEVWTTTFWIGQGSVRSMPGSSCNRKSSWDRNWVRNFGGLDHPTRRKGYRPAAFVPKLNPFYVALPFNDVKTPDEAAKWVKWWQPGQNRWRSQVRGRWLAIEHNGRLAYAQWEDVGPWVTHDPEYVFGGKKHRAKAGLDVSPAVRDYIGLRGSGMTRWRFVEDHQVPDGPWLDFGGVRERIIAARQSVKSYSSNASRSGQTDLLAELSPQQEVRQANRRTRSL